MLFYQHAVPRTPNLNSHASTILGRCTMAQAGAPGLWQVCQGSGRCTGAQAGVPGFRQVHWGSGRCAWVQAGAPGLNKVRLGLGRCTRPQQGAPGFRQVHQASRRCAWAQAAVPGLRLVRLGSGRCAWAQAGAPWLNKVCRFSHSSALGSHSFAPGKCLDITEVLKYKLVHPAGPSVCPMWASSVTKSQTIYDNHPIPSNAHQNQ